MAKIVVNGADDVDWDYTSKTAFLDAVDIRPGTIFFDRDGDTFINCVMRSGGRSLVNVRCGNIESFDTHTTVNFPIRRAPAGTTVKITQMKA